jgi:putative transposase
LSNQPHGNPWTLLSNVYTEFFTASCLNREYLLYREEFKVIVIDSLRFLVHDKRIKVFGFVVMANHIHLLWRKLKAWESKNIQQMFLKYTAQQFRFRLMDAQDSQLDLYRSTQADRQFHFWERRPFRARMREWGVLAQKLNYIHYNPVKAGICARPEDYRYSSARFYASQVDEWGFLTDYRDQSEGLIGV